MGKKSLEKMSTEALWNYIINHLRRGSKTLEELYIATRLDEAYPIEVITISREVIGVLSECIRLGQVIIARKYPKDKTVKAVKQKVTKGVSRPMPKTMPADISKPTGKEEAVGNVEGKL